MAIYNLSPNKQSTTSLMNDLMQTIYPDEPPLPPISGEVFAGKIDGSDEVITLEEYLSKEEIRLPLGLGFESGGLGLGFENNGSVGENMNRGENSRGGNGRGRKRNVVDPVDRALMQRQKRMIKNRESAARSRERKQAYTGELENLVTRLEAENAMLMREQEELHKRRFKQLMENLIPITEKKRPPRLLRRTQSSQW